MRLERIKAYFIDLLVIFIIYSGVNFILPQSENYKKYRTMENQIQEKFSHQEISSTEYIKQYEIVYYNLNTERKVSSACYLILLLLYFVILPYFFNGQTLGLFISHLRIERFTDGKLRLYQFFIRNVIIVGLGYTFLNTILIYFLNEKSYYKAVFAVSIIQIILLVLSFIMVIRKREKRGLHEILSDTEVVSLRKNH